MDELLLKEFQHSDWEAYWSGSWSPIDFAYWEAFYTKPSFTKEIPRFVKTVVTTWQNSKSTCYLRESEKADFAKQVIEQIKQDESYVDKICTGMKNAADKFLSFIDAYARKEINFEQYRRSQDLVLAYYPFHIQVKVCVDYLPKELLEKFLPKFQDARLYAEPVFTKSIEFSKAFSEQQSKKTNCPAQLFETMTESELKWYFKKGTLPQREILAQRAEASAYLFFNGETEVVTQKEFEKIQEIILGKVTGNLLKGTSAYPGKVQGVVRIVMDPEKAGDFQEGDILVTGMTRPEYLSLMKKAAAVVTDAGGVLSHAAIVARELKKPCVIGTKTATKNLKDGDLVEVDAVKGIVKKLN